MITEEVHRIIVHQVLHWVHNNLLAASCRQFGSDHNRWPRQRLQTIVHLRRRIRLTEKGMR